MAASAAGCRFGAAAGCWLARSVALARRGRAGWARGAGVAASAAGLPVLGSCSRAAGWRAVALAAWTLVLNAASAAELPCWATIAAVLPVGVQHRLVGVGAPAGRGAPVKPLGWRAASLGQRQQVAAGWRAITGAAQALVLGAGRQRSRFGGGLPVCGSGGSGAAVFHEACVLWRGMCEGTCIARAWRARNACYAHSTCVLRVYRLAYARAHA